jgi:hypothetical protein
VRVAIFLLLTASGFAQDVIEKRTGEDIVLQACGAEGDTVRFYQQMNPDSTPVSIGAMIRVPGELQCKEVVYRMPGGNAQFYRFYAVPSLGSEMLNSTNGERVKRKKTSQVRFRRN